MLPLSYPLCHSEGYRFWLFAWYSFFFSFQLITPTTAFQFTKSVLLLNNCYSIYLHLVATSIQTVTSTHKSNLENSFTSRNINSPTEDNILFKISHILEISINVFNGVYHYVVSHYLSPSVDQLVIHPFLWADSYP